MTQTRKISYLPEYKASIKIPTNAGTTKWLKSSSEGVGEWSESSFVYEHSWGLIGEAKAETLPGTFIKINTGEKKKIIGVMYKISTGTEITAEIRLNGSGITGLKELKLVEEAKENSTTKELSNQDFLDVVFKSPSGAPKIPSVTVFIEVFV